MNSLNSLQNSWGQIPPHLLRRVHIALIVLLGAGLYLNSLQVPFVLDDASISYIGRVSPMELLLHGGPRRIVDLTFALNYQIHGLQVVGYHVVNLAIHLSAAVTCYFLMVSIFSALKVSYPLDGPEVRSAGFTEQFVPIAAALFFVSHPIQTQAVTYIIQRYTSLTACFYLLSVQFFIKGRLEWEKCAGGRAPWALWSVSIAAGLLAIGSKQISITLPVMLLLLEITLFRGRLITRKFCVVCGMLAFAALVSWLMSCHVSSIEDVVKALHQATTEDTKVTRLTYFLTQTRVVASYLRLLVLPYGQSLLHDVSYSSSLLDLSVIASLALHISIFSIAAVLSKKSQWNLLSGDWEQGCLQRLVCLGIVWYYVALSVESSFFPIKDVLVEHRVYLPSVGFFLAITSCAALLLRDSRAGINAARLLTVVVCIILSVLSIARNHLWNDRLALWQDVVNKYPNQPLALASLSGEYVLRRVPDKAISLYVRAMELGADIPAYLLGEAMRELDMYDSRFTSGKEFMRPGGVVGSGVLQDSDRPAYESVVFNTLALGYEYLNDPENALKYYEKSLRRNPQYDLAWYNVSLLYFHQGDRKQAGNALDQLKPINPRLADALKLILDHTAK